ncbi:unnamed protein product, partial [Polarella glacialis]
GLAAGDMPPVEHFRERLRNFKDFTKFLRTDEKQTAELDRLIQVDIPRLMALIGGVSASGLGARSGEKEGGDSTGATATLGSFSFVRRGSCMILQVAVVLLLLLAVALGLVFSGLADKFFAESPAPALRALLEPLVDRMPLAISWLYVPLETVGRAGEL